MTDCMIIMYVKILKVFAPGLEVDIRHAGT